MKPVDDRVAEASAARGDAVGVVDGAVVVVVVVGGGVSEQRVGAIGGHTTRGANTSGVVDSSRMQRSDGGIAASDDSATPLPPLSTTAVVYDRHGPPEEVLYVDKAFSLPEQLEHGEVLVHMLAACVNDEDLLRVQTSLAVLNDFARTRDSNPRPLPL